MNEFNQYNVSEKEYTTIQSEYMIDRLYWVCIRLYPLEVSTHLPNRLCVTTSLSSCAHMSVQSKALALFIDITMNMGVFI